MGTAHSPASVGASRGNGDERNDSPGATPFTVSVRTLSGMALPITGLYPGALTLQLTTLGISEGTELTLVRKVVVGSLQEMATDYVHLGPTKWTSAAVVDTGGYFAPMDAPCILHFDVSTHSVFPPTASILATSSGPRVLLWAAAGHHDARPAS
mmetsp:Transcript_70127/g.162188  ORF Transcript_70127/g.162188 Transcript_70127/m.162188 type:complete len:154 (-) Transcript_70127:262-723(-)